jgi:hypothetical protein
LASTTPRRGRPSARAVPSTAAADADRHVDDLVEERARGRARDSPFHRRSRVAIGAGFVVYPPLSMRAWVGHDASRPSAVVLARALGARDLVLAARTLGSMSSTPALRRWLAGALVADAADFAVTLSARGRSRRSAGRSSCRSRAWPSGSARPRSRRLTSSIIGAPERNSLR